MKQKTLRALPRLIAALTLAACGGGATVGPGTSVAMKTDFGVTSSPCPEGHPERGCIYLGTLLDYSGPFAFSGPITLEAVRGFWAEVNAGGGIGGHYDVAVPDRFSKDSGYNPAAHTAAYAQIADDVLAVALSLGTPTTLDTLPRMIEDQTLVVPLTYWSGWDFEAVDQGFALETGTSYCRQAMNAIDWLTARAAGDGSPIRTLGIVAFPSDFGSDFAAGAKIAAAAQGVEVRWEQSVVPIAAGGDPAQVEAVHRIVNEPVDLLVLVTAPSELAAIVGSAVQRGFDGLVVASSAAGDTGLLRTAAAPALTSGKAFLAATTYAWGTDKPGHRIAEERLRAAGVEPHDFPLAAWGMQYRLKAALEAAAAAGDLTRAGVARAAMAPGVVDTAGMLPPVDVSQGRRASVISTFDAEAPTGVVLVQDFFVGPTAESYAYERPCTELD